jgi:CRP/FNR family cyclic AMP-dependent transcriptional regulator
MNEWTPEVVELLGYTAAALVLLAFSLRSLVALRTVAIASNVTFIAYAIGAHVAPVLVLHAALLPVNLWRLWQCLRERKAKTRGPAIRRVTRLDLR